MSITKLPDNWRPWRRSPAEPDSPGSAGKPGRLEVGHPGGSPSWTPEWTPASPPRSPDSFQPGSPDGFPPLTVTRNGARARVANAVEKTEWFPADFAAEFLTWMAVEFPDCMGATISSTDIASSFLPRFKAVTGRHHLRLGTLLRGLGEVTKRSEYKFTDSTGRRRAGIEYTVPRRKRA